MPVLIIDNANKIEVEQLKKLQDYAKNATDDKIATVVFVTSEGNVPHIMKARSSWSRRGWICEISDVSENEAFEYLEKKRKIDKKNAVDIYNLVGGRMIDLSFAADKVKG